MHRTFQIKKHNYNLIATRYSTEHERLKSKAGMEIEIFSFSHWKLLSKHATFTELRKLAGPYVGCLVQNKLKSSLQNC